MVGSGYVGLVTGACLAEIGHKVICVDKERSKIDSLNAGHIPIFEPGLEAVVRKNWKAKRLSFTTDLGGAVEASDVVFIAVNTPPLPDGGADLSYVEACTREVAKHTTRYKLLVEKSTVPVQTGERIQKTLADMHVTSETLEVASNPEFLREGSAVQDFLKPDRLVFGVRSKKAEKILRELYKPVKAPVIVTDIGSAELIKHASNSFLAMKISYINAIAQLCEKVGADVEKVATGMGFDRRIGASFLKAGIGYGGSCFPKDVSAFIKIAEKNGISFDLLKATQAINDMQRVHLLKRLEEALWTLRGKTIGVLGLAFKPETDDLRNAPAIDIIKALLDGGAQVRAHDPVAMERMKTIYPTVTYVKSPLEAAKEADAVVLLTEWKVYRSLKLKSLASVMKTPIFVDGRNAFDPEAMRKAGLTYHCVGRPPSKS